jgi:homoisocitrate dehydrogenase
MPFFFHYDLSTQAARRVLEALGSDLPKLEFHDLLAGFDLFTRTGIALPNETVQ